MERDKRLYKYLPENVFEQLSSLPGYDVQVGVSTNLFTSLIFLVESYDVQIDKTASSFRVKGRKDILQKAIRRNNPGFVRDIYGVRLITEESDREKLVKIIQSAYPATPKVFFDGKPSVRDYSDPVVRNYFREKHNPFTSSKYSAVHINIAFPIIGVNYLGIAEVQVMNSKELGVYNQTRVQYMQRRESRGL